MLAPKFSQNNWKIRHFPLFGYSSEKQKNRVISGAFMINGWKKVNGICSKRTEYSFEFHARTLFEQAFAVFFDFEIIILFFVRITFENCLFIC
jgi:hypothetical protein